MSDETVMLAHGAGGRQTAQLIDRVFKARLDNPLFTSDDAAVLPRPEGRIAMTTDGFIVSPPFFPGGDIGKLSVCGTVNDLACMGARPLYLTCSYVIEEGLGMDELERVVSSMAATAAEAGVAIVAGDTKVAGRGQVDRLFITTTGVGELVPGARLSGRSATPGDKVIVTGDVGRHGCTILLARDEFGIEADVRSDCAPLWGPVSAMLDAAGDVHVIRDATRGGVGTVLYEIASESGVGVVLDEAAIPVAPEVRGVCGMLGLEPLYLACEGTMVVFVPEAEAPDVLAALRSTPHSEGAAVIGTVSADHPGKVILDTTIGTQTLLPQPTGELLPRIC